MLLVILIILSSTNLCVRVNRYVQVGDPLIIGQVLADGTIEWNPDVDPATYHPKFIVNYAYVLEYVRRGK